MFEQKIGFFVKNCVYGPHFVKNTHQKKEREKRERERERASREFRMTAAIAVFVSSLVVWFASQSRSVADCRKGQKGMPEAAGSRLLASNGRGRRVHATKGPYFFTISVTDWWNIGGTCPRANFVDGY